MNEPIFSDGTSGYYGANSGKVSPATSDGVSAVAPGNRGGYGRGKSEAGGAGYETLYSLYVSGIEFGGRENKVPGKGRYYDAPKVRPELSDGPKRKKSVPVERAVIRTSGKPGRVFLAAVDRAEKDLRTLPPGLIVGYLGRLPEAVRAAVIALGSA